MAPESRAKYFRERREKYKYISVEVERAKLERLESYLESVGKTKTEWLNETINEVLAKNETTDAT